MFYSPFLLFLNINKISADMIADIIDVFQYYKPEM